MEEDHLVQSVSYRAPMKRKMTVPLTSSWTVPKEYDFSKPTCVNNSQAAGSTQVAGPFESIRANLDFAYHGCYTLDRQELQDQLVQDVVGGGTRHDSPWIIFTAGAMGAGKSHAINWMSHAGYFPLPDIVQVDLDRFRVQLPEWDQYLKVDKEKAGYLTHKESGYCVEIAQEKALQLGKNVWIDGSLRDSDWYTKVFASIRTAHPQYRIAIIHISATWEKICQRAASRAEETGRVVPEEALQQSFDQVPASVARLAPISDFCANVGNDDIPELLSISTGIGEKRDCEGGVCASSGGAPPWEEVRDRFATLKDLRATGDGSSLSAFVDSVLKDHQVVVFSKTYCSFSTRAKQALDEEGVDYHAVELDTTNVEEGEAGGAGVAIQVELSRRSGISTVPQIYGHGVFLGDCSRILALKQSGELKAHLDKSEEEVRLLREQESVCCLVK